MRFRVRPYLSYWNRYEIPCKTISGIWHWYDTICVRYLEYPLVFQVDQRVT
ncbi:hypothetical protein F383_01967 [Gossypium arboreum]|uniref:Uncharacterized protein n=1 Tax=Gossypium arboreum TaxID=29729 RepID=A0A0B0NKM1_GOSAR|nr:hypothetical protein F383_01967 [Gossypium arboreum]